jgi:diaminopimelate decarboxylase/aspartate kinase
MQQAASGQWIVMKFGGTSVSSIACWGTICEQVRRHLDEGKQVLVVVSALSGVTNLLSRLADGVNASEKVAIWKKNSALTCWRMASCCPAVLAEKYWRRTAWLQSGRMRGTCCRRYPQRAIF